MLYLYKMFLLAPRARVRAESVYVTIKYFRIQITWRNS